MYIGAIVLLLVAVALLTASIVLMRKNKKQKYDHLRGAIITKADNPTDPVMAAIHALNTQETGAPTIALGAHPETGKTYIRSKKQDMRQTWTETPKERIEQPGEDIYKIDTVENQPVANLNNLNLPEKTINIKAWKHAFKHRRVDILTAIADNPDPYIAASAYTLAAAAARNSHHPEAEDLTLLAAEMADLTEDNPYLKPFRKNLNYTTTIEKTKVTVTTGPEANIVAGADVWLTHSNKEEALKILNKAQKQTPVVTLLKATLTDEIPAPEEIENIGTLTHLLQTIYANKAASSGDELLAQSYQNNVSKK